MSSLFLEALCVTCAPVSNEVSCRSLTWLCMRQALRPISTKSNLAEGHYSSRPFVLMCRHATPSHPSSHLMWLLTIKWGPPFTHQCLQCLLQNHKGLAQEGIAHVRVGEGGIFWLSSYCSHYRKLQVAQLIKNNPVVFLEQIIFCYDITIPLFNTIVTHSQNLSSFVYRS